MDVNPKSHAYKKRCKKHASRRDYKYGGKIGGHSVKRSLGGTKGPYERICESRLEFTSLSKEDNMLQNADIRLPVEKELGFRLHRANKLNFSKTELVKETLENSDATTKISTLEMGPTYWSGRSTVKKTWYALASNKEDTNGIIAHAQQKKHREAKKMLAEFGLKMERSYVTNRRVKLTRFLPHGEIYNDKVPCIWGTQSNGKQVQMGLLEINFSSPTKVVGIGFRALEVRSMNWTYGNKEMVKVAPLRAKVQYQTFNSNAPKGEWTGTKSTLDGRHTRVHYSGPKDEWSEVAHDLHISNCKSLKIEAMDLTTFNGSLRDVPADSEDSRWKCRRCFEVFVYGSVEPRKNGEEEEDMVPVGSGCIKNAREVQGKVTVVCVSEPETVVPGWCTLSSIHDGGKHCYWRSSEPQKPSTELDFYFRGKKGC